MEANNLPPDQTGVSDSSPPQVAPNAPVSSYSPATKEYPIENLEVHQRGQAAPQVTSAPTQASVPFSRRKALIVSLIITLLVLFITGFAIALFVQRSTETPQLGAPTQDVALENIGSNLPPELEGAEDALFVNGDIITGGELKVFSDSFASSLAAQTLTANQTITLPNASGSLCLDSNNCNFATQDQLTQDTALIDQQAAELTALQAQVDTIAPAVGVTSLNGQSGAVAIQGTGAGISSGGGAVNLSVAYGTTANTAVQGNTTLACASGTGNLAGGGNTITLGASGTCGGLNTIDNPAFGTSVTIGTASAINGAFILQNATNASTVTLNAPNQTTGSAIVSLPDTVGANDTVCLQTLANCGGGATLQSAYQGGNTITTTDARDVGITLADTTTDSNFLVDIATGSTGRFAVQGNGTDVLGVNTTAMTSTLPILGQNGTASAPAYSFSSDTDTGMYNAAADQLGFSAGGTNLLTVGGTDVNLQIPTSNARAEIYGISGTNQEFDIVSDGSVLVTLDEDGDTGSAVFGVYEETTEIFNIDNGGFVTVSDGIFINSWLQLGVDSVTIADTGDGSPATLTLTPLASYIEITCNDPDSCDVTMDDATSSQGQTAFMVNLSANSVDFANSAGVQQLSANPVALGQYDTLTLMYSSDRWIQYATSDNL